MWGTTWQPTLRANRMNSARYHSLYVCMYVWMYGTVAALTQSQMHAERIHSLTLASVERGSGAMQAGTR